MLNKPRHLVFALLLLCAFVGGAAGLKAAPVTIEFLPPPMEGSLSLGIYNQEGKLVRTLHKEAELDDFTKALNGLVTRWDGKDDQGAPCPPGIYRARGYMVGDLGVEGVRFHGNEWLTDDDSPRIRRVKKIVAKSDKELWVEAVVPGSDAPALFRAVPDSESDWKLLPAPKGATLPQGVAPKETAPLPEGAKPSVIVSGPVDGPKDQLVAWAIEGTTLSQIADGAVLDSIPLEKPEDPAPVQLALSPNALALFVLDENTTAQRLWGLKFAQPRDAPGDADPLFVKNIHLSDGLEEALPILKFSNGKPFVPEKTLKVVVVDNPLFKDSPAPVRMKVGVDAEGTYLATEDGLVLSTVSETPHLRWAAIGRADEGDRKSIAIFESDGSAISEFRASKLANVMAFDAGNFEWDPKARPAAVEEAP